jgi:hypothetical protein
MTELKTLKDLIDPVFKRYTSGYVPSKSMKFQKDLINELKQEAIKWIKEDIKNAYTYAQEIVIKNWMYRFNITEEDLK